MRTLYIQELFEEVEQWQICISSLLLSISRMATLDAQNLFEEEQLRVYIESLNSTVFKAAFDIQRLFEKTERLRTNDASLDSSAFGQEECTFFVDL